MKNKRMKNKLRFHLLGLPNCRAGWNMATNPFNTKILYMAKMLSELGYEVFHYGVEGSIIEHATHVDVVSKKLYDETYKNRNYDKPDHLQEESGATWNEFKKNTIIQLNKRLIGNMDDFILNFLGYPLKPITDFFENRAIMFEPGIGHNGSYLKNRIFESYTWQAKTYGKEKGPSGATFMNLYDSVIPAYFDKADYPYSNKKEDYFVYLGRVTWGKGVSVAAEVAKRVGSKLIVIGAGDINDKSMCHRDKDLSHIEHVGVLTTKDKVKYLRKAKGLFYFSLYLEPFGHAPIEAQMCGTPVIASDFGAFSETVLHGITGYRAHTMGELIWAAKNIEKIDPLACRSWAVDNYDLSIIKNMYKAYIERLHGLYHNKDWYDESPINLEYLIKRFPHGFGNK